MDCTRNHKCGIDGPCNGFPASASRDEAGLPLLVEPAPVSRGAALDKAVHALLKSLEAELGIAGYMVQFLSKTNIQFNIHLERGQHDV